MNYCDGQAGTLGACSTQTSVIDRPDSGCPTSLSCGTTNCSTSGCALPTSTITTYNSTCTKYCNGAGACTACTCTSATLQLDKTQYCSSSSATTASTCALNTANCDLSSTNQCETSLGTITNCADCGNSCSALGADACCGNACVDTTLNPAHCGACGNNCGTGKSCQRGACCRNQGQSCTDADDCCSNSCVNGFCSAAQNCENVNVGCEFSGRSGQCADDCTSGTCTTAKTCCDKNSQERIVIETERYKCVTTYAAVHLGKACYENWGSTSLGTAGTVKASPASTYGCCTADLCYTGTTCANQATLIGTGICKAGVWKQCTPDQWCTTLAIGTTTYHCTPAGWTTTPIERCGEGLCKDGLCKKCGTDIATGSSLNGYYCTATGFKKNCETDLDCADSSECTLDACKPGTTGADAYGCAHTPKPCGTSCTLGACGKTGACARLNQLGESCQCETCAQGLYCDSSKNVCAIQQTCGNSKCDAGECLTCPSDCTLGACSGNNNCDTLVGENCLNTPDCKCKTGKCNPLDDASGKDGCLVSACGDGICLPTECASCPLDCKPANCGNDKCDTLIGEDCDNSKDCTCDIELEYDPEQFTLKPNTKHVATFTVKNTGTSRSQYTITIAETPEVFTSWKKASIDLSPGQESLQQIEVWSGQTGAHVLNLNITTGNLNFEQAVIIDVPEPDAAERTSGVVDALLIFKEYWELPAFLIGFIAFLRYLYYRFTQPHLMLTSNRPDYGGHFHNRSVYPHPNYQTYYPQNAPATVPQYQQRGQAWYPPNQR